MCGCLCLQAVRPHTPLIKFPNRQDLARPNGEYDLRSTEMKGPGHTVTVYIFSNVKISLTCLWYFLEFNLCAYPPSNCLAQEALKAFADSLSSHNTAAPPPLTKLHIPLAPIPGTPDTLASVQLLTARYRRRPLTVDEMEYIQVRAPPLSHAVLSRAHPLSSPTQPYPFISYAAALCSVSHVFCGMRSGGDLEGQCLISPLCFFATAWWARVT